ncbi:MAG: recombinase family protein [Bdellovibrionales bacterium]|nr:recombinase family protein [Bdellovibrionales bacterium]
MSNDGLSYRQICDFLTSAGVPTKDQGKGWQPDMIRRLLSR